MSGCFPVAGLRCLSRVCRGLAWEAPTSLSPIASAARLLRTLARTPPADTVLPGNWSWMCQRLWPRPANLLSPSLRSRKNLFASNCARTEMKLSADSPRPRSCFTYRDPTLHPFSCLPYAAQPASNPRGKKAGGNVAY
uniref:Phosphoethanolamine/phosphocholine phosphatase 1 n=1 Tax=Molossus molossus TaxID=27622 RepID=A0A7J8D0K2_MOLMO|nr:phosphoethanolamine/phosphocholine phosphatase 1 [Molossus molossus]